MRFNLFLLSLATLLSACGKPQLKDKGNDNVIGQSLESIAPLRDSGGAEKQSVALFDDVIKKIHQFNLLNMSVERTLSVLNPDSKHYVLHSGLSNYIIDFSEKQISIFDANSVAQHQPISFQGKPKSAAFRPDLGILVMYDDLQSVGVIKLSSTGQVTAAHVFGSRLAVGTSIVSGDLLNDGRLILALSDNSIAIVDLNASLAASPRSLIATIIPTGLTKMNWIAPIPGAADRILIKTDAPTAQVILYDFVAKQVVQQIALGDDEIIKLSKSYDPHVIVKTSESSQKLIYAKGITLQTLDVNLVGRSVSPILDSDLDITNDTWTYVYLSNYRNNFLFFNDVNQAKDLRTLVRTRVTDGLPLQSKPLPDRAQIKLSVNYFFALYPAPLGWAERYSIMTPEKAEMKFFNLKQY